jgi:hypothetical protein
MPLAAAQTNVVPFQGPHATGRPADDLAQLKDLAAQLASVRGELSATVAGFDRDSLALSGIDPDLRSRGLDGQVAALAAGIDALVAALSAHRSTL